MAAVRRGGVLLPSPRPVSDLVAEYGGAVDSDSARAVVRRIVAPGNATKEDDLVLVISPKRLDAALASRGVLLVSEELSARLGEGRRWRHAHALWVVAKVLTSALPRDEPTGVAATASVDPDSDLHSSVSVRAGAVVERGARIGEGTIIGENAVVYGSARIGARCHIGPLAVIGRQGFGFASGPAGDVVRVPHLGGVVIEDDVEIGALVTVDAGTLGPTVIGRGARLDAHVHVAHNVEIGPGAYIAAQAGFAGSSRIGAGVLVGGQAGVKDHAQIGDHARIGGKSGVIGDVAPGDVVAGFPAMPKARWLRAWAALLKEKKRTR